MASTTNDIRNVYNTYKSYISAQVNDTILDSVSEYMSGKLDICKELVIIGSERKNTQYGQAIILTNYYKENIPLTAQASNVISSLKLDLSSSFDDLSAHYNGLLANNYAGSDILKLHFNSPVATSARVKEMIDGQINVLTSYLQVHNSLPLLIDINSEEYSSFPQWLVANKPHSVHFQQVSSYIDTELSSHNVSNSAHENRFKNYYTKTTIDSFLDEIRSNIRNQIQIRDTDDGKIREKIEEVQSDLTNHKIIDTAHKNIFDLYYTKKQTDVLLYNLELTLKNYVKIEFEKHINNGVKEHKDLAPKETPYFNGNIYLNWNKEDNDSHGIYIKGMGNDYARVLLNYTNEDNKTDNAALTISTGDNGSQPIIFQQCIGNKTNSFNEVKTTLTLLDENGNTYIPNDLDVTKKIISNEQEVKKNLTVNGKALINSATLNSISQMKATISDPYDTSKKIPNTEWVQRAIGSKTASNISGINMVKNNDYNNYPIIFYNDITSLTTSLYKNSKITINPNTETINVPKLIATDTIINNIATIASCIINYNLDVKSKASFAQAVTLNSISQMKATITDAGDSTKKIPNTEWVQRAIGNRGFISGVRLDPSAVNNNFPLIFYNYLNKSTTPVLCQHQNIFVNPSTKTFDVPNINASKITLSSISQMKATITDAGDSTKKIPNTEWVQKAIGNKGFISGVILNNSTNNTNFPLIFYNELKGKSTPILCQNSIITVNPLSGIINAKQFTGIAHRAKWGDLAQIYQTDKEYQVGTLVCFGGQKQMTVATKKVNAVISSKPSFLMNKDGKGQAIALVGRVPVLIKGKIEKFDYIGISEQPGIGISIGKQYTQNSIAIALENNDNEDKKLVLCCIQLHI